MTQFYVGTSGWSYPHWRIAFYPPRLPQPQWLNYYGEHFSTVEINNTFYRLPKEDSFKTWHVNSPHAFRFSVKVSRFITHIKKLKDTAEPLATFFDRVKYLEEKLGPLLYQLPPGMHRNESRLESFLKLLPKKRQHVIEFRHESWLDERVFDILRRYNIGLCVFDMPDLTCPLIATADFAYIRFHGAGELYSSCYTDKQLERWAKRISELAKTVKEVYAYFNNDIEGFAVQNAKKLKEQLINI